MIKTVIRLPNNTVLVFDAEGEQIPGYQGQYEAVKSRVLEDAPRDTLFQHVLISGHRLFPVSREEW